MRSSRLRLTRSRCSPEICGARELGRRCQRPSLVRQHPAHDERAPLTPLVPTALVLCTRAQLTPRVLVPGDRGTSARCVLSNQEQIERDSAEEFVVTVDSDIGEIQRLRIGHDESNLGELSLCPLRFVARGCPPQLLTCSCSLLLSAALCCSLLLSAARASQDRVGSSSAQRCAACTRSRSLDPRSPWKKLAKFCILGASDGWARPIQEV